MIMPVPDTTNSSSSGGGGGGADQPVVQRAIKALETVLSPLASSTDRAAANQYCEGIKQDVGQALHLAVTFIPYTSGYAMPVRQFGLNLLEHVVKGLGPVLEPGFLEQLWGLAFGPAGLSAERESVTIKEKMAVVVVQAALRVWPQRWTGLFDLLMAELSALSTAGPLSARQALNSELAVTVVRMLAEEIHQASDPDSVVAWDETRRLDLQAALALVLPGYADWLWAVLPMVASRSSPNDPASMLTLSALIKSFGAVVHWINLKAESTPLAIATLFNIVQLYPGLREDALDALLVFSARPARTNDESLVTALFDQEVDRIEQLFAQFVAGASRDDGDEDQEAVYGYLKRLAEMVVNLATTYVCHKRHPSVPRKLGRLLNVLLGILSLPSLIASSLALIFWGASVRSHEKVFLSPEYQNLLPALFMRLLHGMAAEKKTDRRHKWNRFDFDNERDFDEVHSATTNRYLCIFEGLASRKEGTIEYLRSAISSFAGENAQALKLAAQCNPRVLAQWAALCLATEAMCRGLGRAPPAETVELLKGLLDGFLQVIDPAASHPEVIGSWLYATRGLAVSIGPHMTNTMLIPGCLGLVMSYKSPLPHQGSHADPAEVIVKGRSTTLLLRLAGCAPALFMGHIEALGDLFAQIGPKDILQQRFFTELFLTISTEIKEEGKRVDFIDRVIRSFLEELDRALPWLQAEQLKQASGALTLMSGQLPPESAEFRKGLSNILALTFIIVNKLALQADLRDVPMLVDYVRGTVVPRISGTLLVLLSSILTMSQAGGWAPEHQAIWHELFARRQCDSTNVLAAFDPMPMEGDEQSTVSTAPVQTLRGYYSTIQVSCMVSLGLLARLPGFHSDLGGLSLYLSKVQVASASVWPLSWIVKHVLNPVLIHCTDPSALDNNQFAAQLNQFLAELVHRLDGEWAALEARKAAPESHDLQEEIDREAELVMVSQALVNLVYDVMYPAGERDKKVEPCLDLAARSSPGLPFQSQVAIWFATGDLSTRQYTLVRLLSVSLKWRHSIGYNKVLLVSLRWLASFAMNRPLHELILSTGLLPAVLSVLSTPTLSDFHSAACQLACELYKWSIFFGYDQAVEGVLLGLPCITPAALATWRAGLMEPGKTAKQHRELSRTFFKPMQTAIAKEASGKAFVVPKLPEKLVLLKRLKEEPRPEDEVTADDIDALFAQ